MPETQSNPLATRQAYTSNFPTKQYPELGLIVDARPIVMVEDMSGQKRHPAFDEPDDYAIQITLEKNEGADWNPQIWLGGRFKRNEEDGSIAGYGSAFKVESFFRDFDITKEGDTPDENNRPRKEWLDAAVDRVLLSIRYVRAREEGKLKYYTDDLVAPLRTLEDGSVEDFEMAADDLVETFLRNHKRSGYPKKYKPSLVQAETVAAKTVAHDPFQKPAGAPEAVKPGDLKEEDDDELPF